MKQKIGIDFDNTIVIYDNVFYRYAVENFNMPEDILPQKSAIRDYFWNYPGGWDHWVELQGLVYGKKIVEAEIAPGFINFFHECVMNNLDISIISHKTEYSKRGSKTNLRDAAKYWLNIKGFFDEQGPSIRPEQVFFESTRESKIKRIVSEQCTHFIDDLPEVLNEPSFPLDCVKMLYSRGNDNGGSKEVLEFSNWDDIRSYLFREPV